jgi:hypothetical protein
LISEEEEEEWWNNPIRPSDDVAQSFKLHSKVAPQYIKQYIDEM